LGSIIGQSIGRPTRRRGKELVVSRATGKRRREKGAWPHAAGGRFILPSDFGAVERISHLAIPRKKSDGGCGQRMAELLSLVN
jgi:hypothetical protein